MSIFLNRADFEHSARQAGITALEHDGERYADKNTDMAYTVWLSVALPDTGTGHRPLSWVSIRGGKAVGITPTRPTGPESPDWPRRRAAGWSPAMPVFANVPGVSPEVMSVLLELQRQRQEEGYSVEGDVEHYKNGELARAAACYALQAAGVYPMRHASFWPFKSKMKTCLPAEALTKAAALIFAEVERAKAQGAAQ